MAEPGLRCDPPTPWLQSVLAVMEGAPEGVAHPPPFHGPGGGLRGPAAKGMGHSRPACGRPGWWREASCAGEEDQGRYNSRPRPRKESEEEASLAGRSRTQPFSEAFPSLGLLSRAPPRALASHPLPRPPSSYRW